MKYLKILGLTAFAAMALVAFGASTASATELYGSGVTLKAGTKIEASLATGSTARLTTTAEETLQTCTKSTVTGTTSNTGSATETVKGSVATAGLTFSSCTSTVDVEEGGELEIHWISGTTNGTLTGKGFKVRVDTSLFGGTVTCRYTAGTGTDLGTLTGSTTGNATMDVNAIVSKTEVSSFLCPSDTRWVATYTVTSPTKLTVEEK